METGIRLENSDFSFKSKCNGNMVWDNYDDPKWICEICDIEYI